MTEQFAAAVTAAYRSANDVARQEGEDWYPSAQALAKYLFDDTSLGAGVIASLSPLTPWDRNIELAAMVAHGHPPLELPTLGIACRSVERIVNGEPWWAVLRGPKVRAFASAIETAGLTDQVCVDRHARDLAYGVGFTGIGGKRKDDSGLTLTEYRAIAAAYRAVAESLGQPAPVVQAVTWVVQRGPIQTSIPVTETEIFLSNRNTQQKDVS